MKFKNVITIVFTVLVVGMATLSGIMKLSGNQDVIKSLEGFGVSQFRIFLGLAEIAFAALFAFPKTMRLGFILLSCYFAGAMATELSHGATSNALLPLVFVWIAMLLRDRSVFIADKN
jgi:hypothetical protein